ncbi:hypothetical protein HGP16_29290 [Rhizobium sp. P40RR-XXII]|uniref:hypothetical protein n=1 Tax=unclassified Rhizobium TaxID=2613769 RepID=UPI00145666CF|nr:MULTISPECIES: hypothetical protein [unclassified Rhizobium]NLR88906.1 hypothetical protein [Rhizobium sp. P28RR-XV]NLS20616.1 hypothetical protein [Rhizobium sp. P40RR-XXII]
MKRQSFSADPDQFGFDSLLIEAETVNRQAALEKRFAHLPGTMDEALPVYRDIIKRHHAAMLAGNTETTLQLREEAHDLALRLNNGEPGILAGPDAPGCMLERLTVADNGIVPLWGQTGSFIIEVQGMNVRIDMDGIFGIGSQYSPWMNFSVHAVHWNKPFLSETGYRSFMGLQAQLAPGLTPDIFASQVIDAHVQKELKGRLKAIEPRYRKK